jgi:ABC-type transport system involved in cytochrome c biogenesis permease subunit
MNLLFLLTLLTYLAASLLHVLFLVTGERKISRGAFLTTTVGFGLHTLLIGLRWLAHGQWYDSTTFFAWAIILIYLGIAMLTRLRTIGVFVVPAAFIAIFIAYTLPKGSEGIPPSLWLIAHVPIIFLAYAVFVAAFGFGIMYLIEEKGLRTKRHTLIFDLLPALGQSDELAHRCIVVGVVLLTIGMAMGGLWTLYDPNVKLGWKDWKVILTLATWLIYVAQLIIRQTLGWRGRKTAYSAIIGFAAILCTYIGVKFLPSMHVF